MSKSILVVGEQPSKPGKSGAYAFSAYGDTTKRLARVFGWDPWMMRYTWKFVNLLPYGKWSETEARAAAKAFCEWMDYTGCDGLVLLGRRVQRAFGHKRHCDYFTAEVGRDRLDRAVRIHVLLLPHPSGVNRWWNTFEHRERARSLARRFKRWAQSSR